MEAWRGWGAVHSGRYLLRTWKSRGIWAPVLHGPSGAAPTSVLAEGPPEFFLCVEHCSR